MSVCLVSYHRIHTDIDYRSCMPTLTDLTALVQKYAAAIPDLNLDGDEREEYSTVLLRLQNSWKPAKLVNGS